MIVRLHAGMLALSLISMLAMFGAHAQPAQTVISPTSDSSGASSLSQSPSQPAKPPSAPYQVDPAELIERANKSVGTDVHKSISDWQQELSLIESDLKKPSLHYSELNDSRDQLQHLRGEIHNFRTHLEPALAAAKGDLGLLGPTPAAGQPPEPDDIARSRADRNYYLGVLSAAQTAIDSANLRIDNLIDTIQDIRRKNFTTSLLQPVPGAFSYQTWSGVPDYVPAAMHRVGDIMAGWWDSLSNRDDISTVVYESIFLLFGLFLAAGYGTRRLRHRSSEVDDNPWRRAVVAGALVLLWILPVVVPIAFLYGRIAQNYELPERVDWLLYSTAQSIIIILAVSILAIATLAPNASNWRLVPLSDRAARRICCLVVTLAVTYGVTTLTYTVTRVVLAPFALTIAIALPSSLLQAGIMAAILLLPLEGLNQERTLSPRLLAVLRIPVWIAVFAITISALAGYLALACFLAQQVVVTGSILALAYLLLLFVDGLMHGLADDHVAIGHLDQGKQRVRATSTRAIHSAGRPIFKGGCDRNVCPPHFTAVGLYMVGH
jgi:potassium efflux system protein